MSTSHYLCLFTCHSSNQCSYLPEWRDQPDERVYSLSWILLFVWGSDRLRPHPSFSCDIPYPLVFYNSAPPTKIRIYRLFKALANMETKYFQGRGPQSAHSKLDNEAPSNRLVEIVDSYPGDFVAKYCIAPFARHFFKWEIWTFPSLWKLLTNWIRTLLALLILVYGSLIACNCFNDEEICHKRFNALIFIVTIGFLCLFGYTAHLRSKLQRQKGSFQEI